MGSRGPKKIIILTILFFVGLQLTYAQQPHSWFYENEADLSVPLNSLWSMEIGVGNRGMLQERLDGEKISGYQHDHVELNHFTNYKTKKSVVLSLGLRYRFRELFDSAETDEFRIIEQVELEPVNSSFSHRFRLEQRFRENTIHRVRYDITYSIPMNENFALGVGTEALYAVSSKQKPEAEQRFSIGLENSFFENLELELAFEYRMENYARDLAHEFFVITGVSVSL
ncbi:MAG TPA: DUF2490 domain-containing protein [Salinimicrobium catena]|uniref:DUF2490 domain-containing protein n=1 Tax=Salinimicrobium catena TaxID=390640 RepID=A0A7C2M506_9FLAO|nr:DUF2490 domain-containing protein [Salinimicrobium catena]